MRNVQVHVVVAVNDDVDVDDNDNVYVNVNVNHSVPQPACRLGCSSDLALNRSIPLCRRSRRQLPPATTATHRDSSIAGAVLHVVEVDC